LCFPPIFSLKMGELFAYFEKKMGKFWEKYKIFPQFSRDFPQCTLLLSYSMKSAMFGLPSKPHWQNHRTIWRKIQIFFFKFSQNENIFVKIVQLSAHFDKNLLILRNVGEKKTSSPNFAMILPSAVLIKCKLHFKWVYTNCTHSLVRLLRTCLNNIIIIIIVRERSAIVIIHLQKMLKYNYFRKYSNSDRKILKFLTNE